MIVFVGLILLFLGIVTSYGKTNKFTPQTFYLLWWGNICIFSALRLRGEEVPSILVCCLTLLGGICFVIGYHLSRKIKVCLNYNCRKKIVQLEYSAPYSELRKRLIYAMGILALGFLLILFIRVLRFYQDGYTIGIIRQRYWRIGDGIINNAFEYFIAHSVVDTIILVYNCVFAIQFAQGKLNKKYLILFIFITVLNVFISGGRMNLAEIALMSGIAFALCGRHIRISARTKKCFWLLAVLLGVTIIGLTVSRQGSNNIIATIWSQYTMNIPFMSYLVKNEVTSTDISYGYTFFRGVLDLIFVFLSRFGITAPNVQSVIGQFANPFFEMGNGLIGNAYTSHLFYFYIDGRILGVVIESIIFGFISGLCYKKYVHIPNNNNLLRVLLIFNVIYYGFFQWKFVNSSYVLAFFLMGYIYKNTSLMDKE